MRTGVPLPAWLLYLVVFVAGMTSLAIELSTSRLLGTVLGKSALSFCFL